ncbi:hypothetical protein TrLO_g6704 [Triparma laevis f. longispina]|uniref:BTB domain-containing protein n=1 Tax=Triparma laevis f. longispina TaxID=1714387 RepID=A0A9W7C630_9STRA|nr:hypothetical protein TrLO_g6704 [Triparma laevis f. longispina]
MDSILPPPGGSSRITELLICMTVVITTTIILNVYMVQIVSTQLRESIKSIESKLVNLTIPKPTTPIVPPDLVTHTDDLDSDSSSNDSICINIGGSKFHTTLKTLTSSSHENYFSAKLRFNELQDPESEGMTPPSFFIDRDPTHFRHILNYLRDGDCHLTSLTSISELLIEAQYYSLPGLIEQLEEKLTLIQKEKDLGKSEEKEYKLVHVRNLSNIDSVFKTWMERGYEFEQIMQVLQQNVGGGVVASPISPSRNRSNLNPGTPGNEGGDSFRFVIVFSKSLTNADVTFFDRLMKSSG